MQKTILLASAFLIPGAALAWSAPKPPIRAQEAAGRANTIAFKFNARAQETPGNIFFSPYSMYAAFAMVYEGARNKTAEEMNGVFDFAAATAAAEGETAGETDGVFAFTADTATFHGDLWLLRREMRKAAKGSEFGQANAVWYQFGFEFLPEYTGALNKYHAAPAQTTNFRTASAKVASEINSWVRKNTKGKVSGLFDSAAINPLTRLVLSNAVYFKGKWAAPFDKEATSDQDFTLAGGEKVKVPMMTSVNAIRAGYYENDALQAAGLSYGGTLRLLLLLLRPESGAADTGEAVSPELLAEVRAGLGQGRQKVIVSLPRFRFSSFWDLKPLLSGLGMPQVFAQGADLSGMDGTTTFYLHQAAQKAFIEVNEEGTEAAAVAARAGSSRRARPKLFRADRPFIFLIEDTRTGLILFMGRVSDPRQGD